ncbi:hypothetical protein L7F22_038697 [Adiantum nelumboides]|nr:hypothetical protein [Adiantum nelumboides]
MVSKQEDLSASKKRNEIIQTQKKTKRKREISVKQRERIGVQWQTKALQANWLNGFLGSELSSHFSQLEDLPSLPEESFVDLQQEGQERDCNNLSKHVKSIFKETWENSLCKVDGGKEKGSPMLLVLCSSAARCLDFLKQGFSSESSSVGHNLVYYFLLNFISSGSVSVSRLRRLVRNFLWGGSDDLVSQPLQEGLQEIFDTGIMPQSMLSGISFLLSKGGDASTLRQWRPITLMFSRRIALRVLSQDCSSGPCERNWSTWALFHTKKRNKLSTQQLERLVFCHCNLKLLEQKSCPIEPRQVNPDKIDINKCKEIPDISQEEQDIYAMLYEETLASAHNTRSQRRASTHTRTPTATNEDDEDFQDSDPASEEDDDEVLEDVVVEEVLADEEDILDDDEEA